MIYFMRAGESGHVKIGWTKDHETLLSRRATLQTGQPHPLVVLRTIDDAPRQAEGWLHGFFAGVRAAGEWFEFQPDMLTIEPPPAPTEGWPGPSTRFICRMPNDLLSRLRALAKERSIPMARIVFAGVERELASEAIEAEITRLREEAAWFASKEAGWDAQTRAASEVISKQAEEIAALKKVAAQPTPKVAAPVGARVENTRRPTDFQRASAPNFQPRHQVAHAVLREDET